MSLGIFGGGAQRSKMARPLSYTAAPPRGYGLRGALGASNIPGDCWDATGFKDCHAKAYAQAQSECQGGAAAESYGGDMDTCIERNADAYSWADCVDQLCPQSQAPTAAGASTFSWRNTVPNATVKKLQTALNPYLKQLGANQLTVDGILGSGTCGAAFWVDGMAGTTFYTDYGMAGICLATTMPTKAGTKTPVQTIAVAPQTTITPGSATTERSDLPWGVFNADTVEVQKRLNIQLDAADMNSVAANGTLDAATCGAMRWSKTTQGIDVLSTQGVNCQGFTDPTKKIKAATPVVIPAPSSSSAAPSSQAAPATTQASMATTGLIAAAAMGGLFLLGKKLHWWAT